MSAAEIINEVIEQGIDVIVRDGSLVCKSSEPLPNELVVRIRTHKAEIIDLLLRRQQKQGKPHLKNGELRVSGLLPPGKMLDTLLELGAPDEVIERYIGPHLAANSWERWQVVKSSRKEH